VNFAGAIKYMVIRVLSYNGEDIDTPISDEAIRGFAIFTIQHAAIKLLPQLGHFN
jgi:hypothetical protein